MNPLRIAVFASGNGSNFQAIADAVSNGRLNAKVALLVCDKPQAKVIERARQAAVPVFVFSAKNYNSREAYEQQILAELEMREIDLVVMAGYMRLITDVLVQPLYGRIINIHPALLPAFPGINAIGQALAYGVKVSGVTVHFVDGGMDSGPIIAQQAVAILPADNEQSLAARIHAAEHRLLVEVLQAFAERRVRLAERHVLIDKGEQ
jgi:phosphoribosylglycinamide formyltransferase-1